MRVEKQEDYDFFATTVFASDRDIILKGVVEVTV